MTEHTDTSPIDQEQPTPAPLAEAITLHSTSEFGTAVDYRDILNTLRLLVNRPQIYPEDFQIICTNGDKFPAQNETIRITDISDDGNKTTAGITLKNRYTSYTHGMRLTLSQNVRAERWGCVMQINYKLSLLKKAPQSDYTVATTNYIRATNTP